MAEPLRGSLRCPSSGHAGADSGGSPAKSRGGSSSDLSTVRLLAGRWATVGRTGRRDRERLKPSPGSECKDSHWGACHRSAPLSEALETPKTRPRPDQDPAKIRPIAWSDLPSSCRQVYEALRQDAFLTYRGMVSKLGLNKDTVNTAIGTLVRKGFIRREGNKQTGHWEVVK